MNVYFPMGFALAVRFSKSTRVLLGMALLGFASGGWAQNGTVVAWGDNRTGQGTVPAGLSDVVAIASGEWHNLALRADGTVVAWGYNASVPEDLGKVEAIASGGYHNFALKADGRLRVWGDNTSGQCNVPAGLSNVVAMAGGWQHSIALKADGTVVGWGRNLEGQATAPADLNNVVAISSGEYHNLALKADGTVRAWGWNGYGATSVPAGLKDVIAVAGGGLHSLALKSDGTVVAWGWNQFGQATVPAGLREVVAIAGGIEHSLALKSDGTVVGWGANDGWASNDPNCQFIGSPCERKYTGQIDPPAGLSNVVAIKGGVFHSIALRVENAEPPVAPTLTATVRSDAAVDLAWNDVDHESGYSIERRSGSGEWEQIASPAANATSFSDAGLTHATTYFYRIRALSTAGNSPFSEEVEARTERLFLPSAPTLSSTGRSHSSVALEWSDVDNESGYKLEVKNSAGAWTELATLDAGVTTFNHNDLIVLTAYTYRISAFNAAGSSAYSSELTVTTEAPPVSGLTIAVLGAERNGIRVRISGDAGQSFKVQRTTDFQTWTELTNSILASPSADMTVSGEVTHGFFRTVNNE